MKIREKKQVDALENLKPIEGSKAIKYDDKSLKQRQETYNKSFDEKLDEIQELSRENDYKNLNYDFMVQSILLDIMVHLLFSRK